MFLEKVTAPFRNRALLAAHPEQQAALVAELDAAGLLASAANPRPRAMAFPDLPRLTYLDGVSHPPMLCEAQQPGTQVSAGTVQPHKSATFGLFCPGRQELQLSSKALPGPATS